MAMIATGVATILQELNKGPIGSGYLCPLVNGPAFLSASILACKAGGLSMVFGMTFIGGLFEAARIELVHGTDGSDTIFTFMQRHGSLWGAMPDVISHAASDINEIFEATAAAALVDGPLKVEVSFDEFNLDVDISYKGRPMPFPDSSPSGEEMLASPDSLARMSGFIVRRHTDKVESGEKDGLCRIRLHYIH